MLLPLVRDAARRRGAVRALATAPAPLGAMIETVEAAARVDEIAAAADFLSIGTNDLTADVLGVDRFAPGEVATHNPRVLAQIARVGEAARPPGSARRGLRRGGVGPAHDPAARRVRGHELSVGAARVAATPRGGARARRRRGRRTRPRGRHCARDVADVERLLAEAGHELGERGDGA